MPQKLQDIMAQLDPVYNPQKAVIAAQQAALPEQQAAEQAGLETTKNNAFQDINVQANDRGLSYSGAPIAEQSKYLGASYLPAVANLKSTYANKGFQLSSTLASLEADRVKQAQGVYNDQLKTESEAETARRAAAAQGLSMQSLMGAASAPAPAAPAPVALPTFSKTTNPADVLKQMYAGYAPGAHPYYTENVVIPALKNLIQQKLPNSPNAQAIAESLAFKYRKANFGE